MSPVYEPSQYQYWIAKQTAQGAVPAAGAYHALAITAGDLALNRDDGQERYPTYGNRFYSGIKWVNSLQGQGDLTAIGDPTAIGALAAFFLGTDTKSGDGTTTPHKHILTPAAGSPWCAVFKKAGVQAGSGAATDGPRRERFNDCRLGQLVIAGSTENKAVVATGSFFSADPAEYLTGSDPTASLSTDQGFVFTEGAGAFKLSANTSPATVFTETIGFTITMNDVLNPVPGDSAVPIGFINGEATVTVEVTLSAATNAIREMNKLIYGAASPTTGAKPLSTIQADGALDVKLTKAGLTGVNARSFQAEVSGVSWTPSTSLGTNTDGTPAPITFTGEGRLRAADPMVRITVEGGASAAYV